MKAKWLVIAGAVSLGAPVLAANNSNPDGIGTRDVGAPDLATRMDRASGGSHTGGWKAGTPQSAPVIEGRVVQVEKKKITLNTGGTDMVKVNTHGLAGRQMPMEGEQVRVAYQNLGHDELRAERVWVVPAKEEAGTGGSGIPAGAVPAAPKVIRPSSGANDAIRSGDLGQGATGNSPYTFGQGSGAPDQGTPSGVPQAGNRR